MAPLRDAVALVATADDVCARLRGGGLRCVRGDGTTFDVPEGEGARAVVGAGSALLIQRADGAVVRVFASRARGAVRSAVVVDEAHDATGLWGSPGGWCYARDQRLWCRGAQEGVPVGGHGVRGSALEALPVAGPRGTRWASVGYRFACALAEGDDAPRCWGEGLHLFSAEPGHYEQLVPPGGAALASVTDLVARGPLSCALMERDPPRCWGNNEHRAALGSGRASSVLPIAREVYGAPVASMAWHGTVGCAVAQGALRCVVAGGSYAYELASDRAVTPTLPAPARSVAITESGACASLVDGRVACAPPLAFRTPRPGELDVPPEFVIVPELAEVTRVMARGALLCALSDTRPARCWGDAMEWEALPAQSAAPVELPHLGPVRSLASGENHACAVDVRGAVWCWGRGRAGQLGMGVFSERARPARVALEGEAQEVAVGRYHSCARVDGALWCWGGNAHGQLGDGTTAMRAAPVRVAGVEGVTRVVADGDRTCAVGGDRRVYCWGAGEGHALGNGAVRDRHEPTPVRGE